MDGKTQISLIYENILKSIATARSECTTKHGNKASYNKDFIVPDLIDFLAMIEKRSKRRLKKEIFIFVKNIIPTKNKLWKRKKIFLFIAASAYHFISKEV